MPYTINARLQAKIDEIKKEKHAQAEAREEADRNAGKVLTNNPVAVMREWPTEYDPEQSAQSDNEKILCFSSKNGNVLRQRRLWFPRGQLGYLEARRFWDAYKPVKELLLEDGATDEEFFELGPTLFPWTYGILIIVRVRDEKGVPHLLVGIRSAQLAGRHVGTVSFPGGLVKPNERIMDAASRQMQEECKLQPDAYYDGVAIGNHPNAGSTTFICVANMKKFGDVGDSFEWKGGKAVWAPEEAVKSALAGDTQAMVDVFHRADINIAEGAPMAPDVVQPASLLLNRVYPA